MVWHHFSQWPTEKKGPSLGLACCLMSPVSVDLLHTLTLMNVTLACLLPVTSWSFFLSATPLVLTSPPLSSWIPTPETHLFFSGPAPGNQSFLCISSNRLVTCHWSLGISCAENSSPISSSSACPQPLWKLPDIAQLEYKAFFS